ncbi:methyl-accepting chemotaxis protein [Aneurinibacillus sp. Ricciae_BoGa-3]|uniref:methyl-accepting chemotaxis protein n=1 Tax=Aneurinibacillus sp. Ricciae_BoGa-3 TaxID=3022697 RepID=UPI002341BD22|nr:methyl-accepting chemotaxis protein [Aneurinibacillus sp. Ricciae_BoGa-3]WCK55194.1 methyl-accepting chemotaxis protein [Aneurinibacillus sp. Ricciae_BoGa-3]
MFKKGIGFKSLRTKLIIMCLLILAIPGVVIGTVGYNISKTELNSQGQKQLKLNVHLAIAMIDSMNKQVKAGKISLQDAQELIRQQILGPKGPDNKRSVNKNLTIGDTGYIFAINSTAVSVMNPNNEGKNISNAQSPDGVMYGKELVNKGLNGGGFVTYKYKLPNSDQLATKISYIEQDPNWGWLVGQGAYVTDFNQGANQVLYILLITLGISLVLGALLVWFFASRVTKPIVAIAEQTARISNGDLTVEPIIVKTKDEVGRLARDFKTMVENLRNLIGQVSLHVESVASTSEQFSASAEQVKQATQNIATTMQEVAIGTDSQNHHVEESSDIINQMVEGIQHIHEHSQSVSSTAEEASTIVETGNTSIRKTVHEMGEMRKIIENLAVSVQGLGQHSTMIGKAIEVIRSIADQTNLLALNAAIEAARAGENGRGFAVVADEVRKLAEQSSESAKHIGELINTIQNEISNVIASSEKGTQEFLEGIESVQEAGESFEHIQNAIQEVTSQIQEVSASVQQISSGTDQVVLVMGQITTASQTTAAGTQTVSAATEEQLASMEEISASASSLSKMAEELQLLTGQFKL